MNLRRKISVALNDLPTLPTIYSALSEAMSNPVCTAHDVADILSSDQASAFRILKAVNSAFYGFPSRIDSVSHAVLILGFDEIRNLILASSIIDLFSKSSSVLTFRPTDFWAHSIAVGILTRHLGQAAGITAQDNLFVAGILHDIGKLAFFECIPEEYGRVLAYAAEQNCPIRVAEKALLEFDHTVAGTLLAERWKIPQSLRNVIADHHKGYVQGKPDLLVVTVLIADMAARALELGFGGDNGVPEPPEFAWDILHLKEGTLESMIPTIRSQYQEAISVLLSR